MSALLRRFLIVTGLTFPTCLAAAAAPAASDAAAQGLIAEVIRLNNQYPFGSLKENKFFDVHSTPLMHRYFTSGYCHSWDRAMTFNKQMPVWDADPINGEQMVGRLDLKSVSIEHGDTATATVLRISGQGDKPATQTIVFKLVRENGQLKIDNIRRGQGGSQTWYRTYLDRVK